MVESHVAGAVDPAQGPGPVRRDSALPLWAQINDDLRRRVGTGEFVDSFPGELALMEQYAVSRHTVREALRRLREDGLVIAERGRRPRLAEPPVIDQPMGTAYSLFQSVEAAGRVQTSVVRTLAVSRDERAAAALGLEPDVPLVHLERLRLADDEPLAVDSAWLPEAIGRPLLEADFTRTALYAELADRCGVRVTGGSEHVRAVVASADQRADLDIGPDVAVFLIDRVGRAAGRPVEVRRTVIRGDRFELTAHFAPGSEYRLQARRAGRPGDAAGQSRRATTTRAQ